MSCIDKYEAMNRQMRQLDCFSVSGHPSIVRTVLEYAKLLPEARFIQGKVAHRKHISSFSSGSSGSFGKLRASPRWVDSRAGFSSTMVDSSVIHSDRLTTAYMNSVSIVVVRFWDRGDNSSG